MNHENSGLSHAHSRHQTRGRTGVVPSCIVYHFREICILRVPIVPREMQETRSSSYRWRGAIVPFNPETATKLHAAYVVSRDTTSRGILETQISLLSLFSMGLKWARTIFNSVHEAWITFIPRSRFLDPGKFHTNNRANHKRNLLQASLT